MTNRGFSITVNNLANEEPLELHFSHLSYHDISNDVQPILINACGTFRSGRLTGIVGQSIAEKSTLISILSGDKFGETNVLYKWIKPFYRNRLNRSYDLLSFLNMSANLPSGSVTSYLPTVQETLDHWADLKLPKSTSKKQKHQIVNDIVELLDLQSCRETLIRDISKGEHKRLSNGIELFFINKLCQLPRYLKILIETFIRFLLKLRLKYYINLWPNASMRPSVFNIKISGRILINGPPQNLRSFRKISSYIDKIPMTLCLLTVEETLKFSADLKLPKSTSKTQKQHLVNEIIELLDLQSCRGTLVRDISGSEHKRLSIGIGLISNPRLIFIDEPTSGIDNISGAQVMACLQRLAQQGRIVVCVMNQPSSPLMHFLDDILVLSQGEVLYSGPQSDFLECCEAAGFTGPQFDNFGDQWEESDSTQQCCENLIIQNKERHHCLHAPVGEHIPQIDLVVKIVPSAVHEEVLVSWYIYILYVLVKRQLRCTSRNMISELKKILFRFIVGMLLSIVYYLFGLNFSESLEICQTHLLIGNFMRYLMLLMKDYPLVNREYCNGCYSRAAYYISKGIADFPMQLIWSTLLIILQCSMSDRSFGSHLSNIYQQGLLPSLSQFVAGQVKWSLISMFLAMKFFERVRFSSAPFLFIYTLFIRKFPLPDPHYIIDYLKRPVYYYRRVKLLLATELMYMQFCGHFFKVFEKTNKDLNWEIMAIAITIILAHTNENMVLKYWIKNLTNPKLSIP